MEKKLTERLKIVTAGVALGIGGAMIAGCGASESGQPTKQKTEVPKHNTTTKDSVTETPIPETVPSTIPVTKPEVSTTTTTATPVETTTTTTSTVLEQPGSTVSPDGPSIVCGDGLGNVIPCPQ